MSTESGPCTVSKLEWTEAKCFSEVYILVRGNTGNKWTDTQYIGLHSPIPTGFIKQPGTEIPLYLWVG